MTASQRIIRDDGVIFGPGKVKDHVRQLNKASASATAIIPPTGFGTTVQTLLENGITYSWKSEGNALVRTWSLPEVWEATSWPRDSDSSSNVRFGFPVVDDVEADDENEGDNDDDDFEEEDEVEVNRGFQSFITDITSVQDLTREVIKQDKDCVLCLSANYCRTCKTIAPAYTRLARINHSDKLLFCRADTAGSNGKELSKTLNVNAVPLFLLLKQGGRFGTALKVNKLPSKKLDLALEFLRTGSTCDSVALENVKGKGENDENSIGVLETKHTNHGKTSVVEFVDQNSPVALADVVVFLENPNGPRKWRAPQITADSSNAGNSPILPPFIYCLSAANLED